MIVGAPFKHLKPGTRYIVRAAFSDHDGVVHPVGESWTFQSHNFVPYEDGLSLYVRWVDGSERQIRLQWRPETEGGIIDKLDFFIAAVQGQP